MGAWQIRRAALGAVLAFSLAACGATTTAISKRDLDVQTANFEDFYARAAAVPNLQLARLDSIEDSVQIFFLAQLGHQVTSLAPLLSADIADLRKSNPKLRTYTMPGAVHTILTRPAFYTSKVDDVELTKWLDEMEAAKK